LFEKEKIVLLILIFVSLGIEESYAQISTLREYFLPTNTDTIVLDSLSIYPQSFELFCGDKKVKPVDYFLDGAKSLLVLKTSCLDSFTVRYRVFPYNLSAKYQKRDTSILYRNVKQPKEQFLYSSELKLEDVFGGSGLEKNGGISRGISFGNSQDMGVRSSLNLELNGDISPNLKLLASLSDDNIPIQPEGNTSKLQEFDKVFVQLYNDRLKLIAGDFWIENTESYFLKYNKRAQGLFVEYDFTDQQNIGWKTQTSGAFSKGKFHRQFVQATEGNQGPYRLVGAENEPFIIILAGTERITLNGRLLNRGQDADYMINYNIAEVIFTSNIQITKDSRIVIEFQYSDQNYARTLFQTSNKYHSKKIDFSFNIYTEQDAKNQTIQQEISLEHKMFLATIGDDLQKARIPSIDSVGFIDNQVLYKMIDSLGYDSVLVYSVAPSEAIYRATFVEVGEKQGNYVLKDYVAAGKVYEWISPIAGVPQGNFAPIRTIITPKKKQMITTDIKYKINDKLTSHVELAYTNNDLNTFSQLDRFDDKSIGVLANLNGVYSLFKTKQWKLDSKIEIKATEKHFSPIEEYKSTEYQRNWNIQGKNYKGNEVSTNILANVIQQKYGNIEFKTEQMRIGNDFIGNRAEMNGNWTQNGFSAEWDGSVLNAKAEENSAFIRQKIDVSQKIAWIRVGLKDEYERNIFSNKMNELTLESYQFWDYQVYITNADSNKYNYRIFYQERYDKMADSIQLRESAKAQNAGVEFNLQTEKQSLKIQTSYRQLHIIDTNLLKLEPENSLLGNINYEVRMWKNSFTWNSFYEITSGLEQKREFLYLQVANGQGIYTWNDYNADGIKDLNEFEIAKYVDQANYVRVYTPTNKYTKTYANELNQTVFLRPERLWSKTKGFLGILALFSEQIRIRIHKKNNIFERSRSFNPFLTSIQDTNTLTSSYDLRNTVYFNRMSSKITSDWTYQKNQNKMLLASGFDSRETESNEITIHWNITPTISIETKGQKGTKKAMVDYTSGRNFYIQYRKIQPEIAYQGSTAFRISLTARYEEKQNNELLGAEHAFIGQMGTTIKVNQVERGSFQAEINVVSIRYNGTQNSALGFEMLEALQNGTNYTWTIGYQRNLGNNLQLSMQYNGRRSENSPIIHSANMELRAFF